jgi:hypothetical protein
MTDAIGSGPSHFTNSLDFKYRNQARERQLDRVTQKWDVGTTRSPVSSKTSRLNAASCDSQGRAKPPGRDRLRSP